MKEVLIIEADDAIRETLQELIAAEGHNTTALSTGSAALDWLRTTNAHLIFCDYIMPGMNGAELRQELLKVPRLAEIPFYLMSARNLSTEELLPLTVQGHLRKPFSLDELSAILDEAL
jgi:CheY-like chemotaxis protein